MNDRSQFKLHIFPVLSNLSIVVFCLLFLAGAGVVEITTSYESTWDGPFFMIIVGKMAGYLPSHFSFTQATWKNRHGGEEFFMGLDDDDGKSWLRLHSEKSHESALWLPRKHKEILNFDVIRFVRTLRKMFSDSSCHTMKGTFTFSKKKLYAEAREYVLSQDEEQKFRPARAFNILTFDTTGAPGIGGRVIVSQDSVLHYRKVYVNLPDDEIEVALEEQTEK